MRGCRVRLPIFIPNWRLSCYQVAKKSRLRAAIVSIFPNFRATPMAAVPRRVYRWFQANRTAGLCMLTRKFLFAALIFLSVASVARADNFRGVEMRNQQPGHLTANLVKRRAPILLSYVRPSFDEYDEAIGGNKTLFRGRIVLDEATVVSFYETPKDVDFVNSTIVVKRRGSAAKTYNVDDLINHQALSLAYAALIRSDNDETMLVCNYADGFASMQPQGFAILHFSPSGVALNTLPLTDAGKVVVFKSKPWLAEVWSSLPEPRGSVVEPRPYATQLCHWQREGYRCASPKRQKSFFSPLSVTDPGIDIRP